MQYSASSLRFLTSSGISRRCSVSGRTSLSWGHSPWPSSYWWSGIYFTLRLGFVQIRQFMTGVRTLATRRSIHTGISPLAAFLLSTAMRVGPGNMIGVTGAIAAGGPGALFWMWISAFFGMATAFTEGTLAQIFKEKRGDQLRRRPSFLCKAPLRK